MTDAGSESDKPVLVVVEGAMRGQQWVVHRDSITVGRGGDCDIIIPERRVSREHIRIWREGSHYYVEDLDSRNGTHVNAQRLEEPVELHEGDEIEIALAAKLKFVGSEATVPLISEPFEEEVSSVGLRLDPNTRQVIINGITLDPQLSLYQYRLLELLYNRGGGVCTRDDVVRSVWPDAVEEGVSEQAIDALVRRLRDRLAEVEVDHQFIVTVRGHGFRLEQPDSDY